MTMWFVPYLIETRAKTAWPTLASYRVCRLLRSGMAPIATWRRRERELQDLCRYSEHEFRDLPRELNTIARVHRGKRLWES
jgi:uncharacterized protein YjiS (DUF1127 family)